MATEQPTSPTPFDLATRLAGSNLQIDRIARLSSRYAGPRHKSKIAASVDAAERRLDALEHRIVNAVPRDISDVVAQLVQIAHNVNVAIENPTEDRREQVSIQIHGAIRFLADYADVDLGEVGGNTYLIAAYMQEVAS